MKNFVLLCLAILTTAVLATSVPTHAARAADAADAAPATWLRYPAISPDGATILFACQGDIWSVPAAGGDARPLTVSESYEFAPVWSHDGRSIAFASDRFGNLDVFVMPAAGGPARRLTSHSADETPSGFTADDASVYFSARGGA